MNEDSASAEALFLAATRPVDGVLRLTMSRPERRNALSLGAMNELLAALKAADLDPQVGCVLIEAQGPVFCAGHDLKEMAALQKAECEDSVGAVTCDQVFEVCSALMTHLVRSGTPSLAVVRGLATAAGCQLVASCDLAIASEHASFATPGVDIGLFCSTPAVALSRNISRKAAMEMLLLGERMPARRAVEVGLINRTVEDDDLEAVSLGMASAIASKPRDTVAAGKANFYRQIELGLESAYAEMGKTMVNALLAADAQEGIGAFLDKRKPRWNES